MKASKFQRRQISGTLFLVFVALVLILFSRGPLKSRFESQSRIVQLEQLAEGQRTIIARSGRSQIELDKLRQGAGLEEQLLQGRSLNMAIAQAQGTLTSLVEDNGGKILRVANVNASGEKGFKGIATSVHFECNDQKLNDILHAIEFGRVNFIIDRAEVRARRNSSANRSARKTKSTPADALVVRIDVRGFWQKPGDPDS